MDGLMMDFPLSINHLVDRVERLFPTVEVVTRTPDRTLVRTTYASVAARARRLGEALLDEGLRPGDRVASLMWNHSNHLETYLGVPIAGGVLLTLNLRVPPEDLAFIIQHAKPRWLVVDDVLLPLYERIRQRAPIPEVRVVPFSGKAPATAGADYEEWIARPRDPQKWPPIAETDAAGLCYTSGTTGRPKGALYSHRSVVLHSFGFAVALEMTQRETVCPVVPMFHANAWGIPHVATMLGDRLVLPGPHLDAPSLLDLFETEQVSFAAGVPSIWFTILEALDREPHRWKLVDGFRSVVGGAAVPETMLRRFDHHGIRVIHAWGMTETSPLGTVSIPKRSLQDLSEREAYALRARQGLPSPLVEVRVRSEAGVRPWDGKSVGELEIRGPWIARAYFELPEASDRWTEDGWFRTGDVATIDPEGYVQITDRLKDLVKSGGEWISSVELENLLVGHPAVREAAVIARPDPRWGERPHAVVVLREGASVTPEELNHYLEGRVPKYWMPDSYAFVNVLPKTATGKVSKLALRESLARESRAERSEGSDGSRPGRLAA